MKKLEYVLVRVSAGTPGLIYHWLPDDHEVPGVQRSGCGAAAISSVFGWVEKSTVFSLVKHYLPQLEEVIQVPVWLCNPKLREPFVAVHFDLRGISLYPDGPSLAVWVEQERMKGAEP